MFKDNFSKTLQSYKEIPSTIRLLVVNLLLNMKLVSKYDPLTKLLNNNRFIYEANHKIKNSKSRFAFIQLDIAKFSWINDRYGMHKGDELLRYITFILKSSFSIDSTFSRLGNDIFCICTKYNSHQELLAQIEMVTNKIQSFPLIPDVHRISPYFGICITTEHEEITSYINATAIALDTIKGNSLRNYAFYQPIMKIDLLRKDEIESEMFNSLSNNTYKVYLQPKCDISSLKVVGAEALVRWDYPSKGILMPDTFIPIFEENEFIIKLDQYVWEKTCVLLSKWIRNGITNIPVSVNISRAHLKNTYTSNTMCEYLLSLIKKYKIPFNLLELEFTESSFSNNNTIIYDVIDKLHNLGFRIAMDDFGSGYSSLNMLNEINFDIIKIDKYFIRKIDNKHHKDEVITGTINLLNRLKVDVVVEGIETNEQANFLLAAGCNTAQGYLYSKPLPVEEFELFLIK